MRGYDKTEVDTFKEQVAQTLETSKQELMRVTMELEAVKLQFAGIKQFEDTIKGAAIDARRNADATIALAKKEAELILQNTKTEVETIIASRRQRISEVESELEKLELARQVYLQKLRSMIGSHLELVEAINGSETAVRPKSTAPLKESSSEDLEITDSSEVRGTRRETVATPLSKGTSERTEEANAPSHIMPVAGPIDAELAEAVKQYQSRQQGRNAQAPDRSSIPDRNQTRPAEEAPSGFVNNNQDTPSKSERAAGTNSSSGAPIPAEVLAKELDEVVAKFAEEMDKAAKS
jgi:cell division septum initiation protein DivIVA